MDQATTIRTLNHLIALCHDSHDGYQAAAHVVDDMELKRRLGHYGIRRREFAETLGREVERLGAEPAKKGTLPGALHRGLLQLGDQVRHPAPKRVLRECEKGDSASLRHYEEALPKLPPNVRRVAEEQRDEIVGVWEELKQLEQELA